MAEKDSKPIVEADDSSKRAIIEALKGDNTYGFDVESIYYLEKEDKWIIYEFLKCDHPTVRPRESHPKRYWFNWRKFASLWRLKLMLNAELFLINYEDLEHARMQKRVEREYTIIRVLDMNPTHDGGILSEEITNLDFDGFSDWFRNMNNRGKSK